MGPGEDEEMRIYDFIHKEWEVLSFDHHGPRSCLPFLAVHEDHLIQYAGKVWQAALFCCSFLS